MDPVAMEGKGGEPVMFSRVLSVVKASQPKHLPAAGGAEQEVISLAGFVGHQSPHTTGNADGDGLSTDLWKKREFAPISTAKRSDSASTPEPRRAGVAWPRLRGHEP